MTCSAVARFGGQASSLRYADKAHKLTGGKAVRASRFGQRLDKQAQRRVEVEQRHLTLLHLTRNLSALGQKDFNRRVIAHPLKMARNDSDCLVHLCAVTPDHHPIRKPRSERLVLDETGGWGRGPHLLVEGRWKAAISASNNTRAKSLKFLVSPAGVEPATT